jgi:hypothetical protein
MKLEFWIQGPNSRDSIGQALKHQIKRHGESRERFITRLGTCHGKRQSKHSAHPQGTDMSYRLK